MDFNSINKTIEKILDKKELLDTDWMNLAYIADLVKREQNGNIYFRYLEEIPTRFMHKVVDACNCGMLHANNLIEFVFSQEDILRRMNVDYELHIACENLKKRDKT